MISVNLSRTSGTGVSSSPAWAGQGSQSYTEGFLKA